MNLEMSRRVASKIRRQPALFRHAVETLEHWKRVRRPNPGLREWERILRRNSVEKVLSILTQENEEGNRLRQTAPFCGIMSQRQSNRLYRQWCEEE